MEQTKTIVTKRHKCGTVEQQRKGERNPRKLPSGGDLQKEKPCEQRHRSLKKHGELQPRSRQADTVTGGEW